MGTLVLSLQLGVPYELDAAAANAAAVAGDNDESSRASGGQEESRGAGGETASSEQRQQGWVGGAIPISRPLLLELRPPAD